MSGMFAVMAKLMTVVQSATTAAGLSEAEMASLKTKLESKSTLTTEEKAKLQKFGAVLGPALENVSKELGDQGAGVADRIRSQFDQMLAQV